MMERGLHNIVNLRKFNILVSIHFLSFKVLQSMYLKNHFAWPYLMRSNVTYYSLGYKIS